MRKLPRGWQELELGKALSVGHGFAFKGTDFVEYERHLPVVLKPGNFGGKGGLNVGPDKLTCLSVPHSPESAFRPGEIAVVMTCMTQGGEILGAPGRIPDDGRTYLHNQRIGRIAVTRPDLLANEYVYFLFCDARVRRQLVNTASGSTVLHTSPGRIGEVRICLPSLQEQRAIAEVLEALDDKIESNRRLSLLADSVALTVYREWYRSFGTGMPHLPISELAMVVLGGTPSRKRDDFWTDGSVAWVASGEVNKFRIIEPTALITEDALAESATKLMPAGTAVLAITGATCGQVSRLEIEAAANQSVIGIVGSEAVPNAVSYFWLQTKVTELMTRTTGAAQQHVNKGDVEQLEFPVLDGSTSVRDLLATLEPLVQLTSTCLMENLRLVRVRDALLPRLISGKLRVQGFGEQEEPA